MHFRRETEFKDTEIGRIPKEWEVVRLEDITAVMYYGITAKAVNYNTGLRMLRTTDIKDYSFDPDTLPNCEITESRNDIAKYYLKKDDIIIARAGTVGVSVLIEKDIPDTIFGSYLIKIRLNKIAYPKFIRYYFQSTLYWNHINQAQGSTLKNINLPLLRSLLLPLPSLPEQQKIAEILSTIDEAIQKTDEIIAKTELLKKCLMQELLTKGVNIFALEKDKIISAVERCLKNRDHEFGREENLNHHLARYLEEEFPDYDIDVEVVKQDRSRPDIIIHKRNTEHNLFAIEVKKHTRIDDVKRDIEKLEEIMLDNYKYCEAIFIGFDVSEEVLALSDRINFLLVNRDGYKVKFRRRELKDTEIGRIPKEWEVVRLGKVVEVWDKYRVPVKEQDRRQGPYPYCGANGVIDYVDGHTHDGAFVLLAEDGGFFGPYENSAYIMQGKFWANNHVHILKAIEGEMINEFLMFYLNFIDLRPFLTGSTRPKLTQNDMVRIPLPKPTSEEQQKIAEILSTVDRKLELERNEKAKLERIKKGLMDLLLTGKVRVRV